MSDDGRSQELLAGALAGQRVCSRVTIPHGAEITVDMVIDATSVNGLSILLGELQMISRQVFVSSVDQASALATTVQ